MFEPSNALPLPLGNAATASERGPPTEPGWQGSALAPSENPVTRALVGPHRIVFVGYFAAAMRSRRVGAEAIRDPISAGLVHARYSAAYSGGKTSTICSFSTHTSIT